MAFERGLGGEGDKRLRSVVHRAITTDRCFQAFVEKERFGNGGFCRGRKLAQVDNVGTSLVFSSLSNMHTSARSQQGCPHGGRCDLDADDSSQDALGDCDDEDDPSNEHSGPPEVPPLGLTKCLNRLGVHDLQISVVFVCRWAIRGHDLWRRTLLHCAVVHKDPWPGD